MQSESAPRCIIIVFARAPRPGHCKTRLIPAYGKHGAARLYRHLARKTVASAVASGCGPVQLWQAGLPSHPFLRELANGYQLQTRTQCSGDLGQRMAHAIAAALNDGADIVLLVGTDAANLCAADFRSAARTFCDGADAVLQPSLDGGYVLIGARRAPAGALRGIDWSSGKELSQTRTRLERRQFRVSMLAPRLDIDSASDVRRAKREGWL